MALINFSLPIIPSFTKTEPDKLIDVKLWDGSITQQLLFIPDTKILSNFFKGELGIADGIKKKMILGNLSKITNSQTFEKFLSVAGGRLPKPFENYFKDGKLTIDPAELILDALPGNLGGLKALEKSIIQSIFETKKPYIEIIKLVLENLVKIEDIIARVLAVSGSSMSPKNNPKALGYQGNSGFLQKLAELESFATAKSDPKPLTAAEDSTPEQLTTQPEGTVTQSVVFSTGTFNPNAEYTYIYEYLKEEPELGVGTASIPPLTDDNHLPEYVVFGVFNSNWEQIDERLITSTLAEAKVDGSADKNINWINRSGKWFGKFEQIEEGKDYDFVKDVFGNTTFYVNDGPSVNVDGENKFLKKGLPKIKLRDSLNNLYNDYYLQETTRRATKKGLSASQVQEVADEISTKIGTKDSTGASGIQTTIEGTIKNGFLNSTDLNNTEDLLRISGGFPRAQNPFKPKKVTFKGEQVWIDGEAKYDMKIIKCDSSTDISFLDIEPDNRKLKTTKIVRFVKNTLSIRLDDRTEFYYEFDSADNLPIPIFGNTVEISIDNTRGAGIFGAPSFRPVIRGNLSIFRKFMDPQYVNGIIFTHRGRNLRLIRFFDTWKIEEIYWTIDSTKREGDIVSLGVGRLTTERDGLGVRRVKVTFPNNIDYYFTTFDGQFMYRKIYSNVSIDSIQPQNLERVEVVVSNTTSTRTVSTLPANSIRVEDDRYKFGKLISNTQILNDKLAESKPFSTEAYGTPVTIKESNGNKKNLTKQKVSQIYRFQQTEDDTETYFIVEGILSEKNKQKLNSNGNSNGGSQQSGSGDYSFPDVIGVIPVFIEMLIDVFAKLIPNITALINLISNPAKFITDIIIAKIGDNNGTEPEKFGIFGKKFMDDLKKLGGNMMAEKAKAGADAIGSVLRSVQSSLGNVTTGLLQNSLSGIGDIAGNFAGSVQGALGGSLSGFQNQFGSVINNLQNQFGNLPSQIGGLLPGVTSAFANIPGQLSSGLSSFTTNAFGNIQGQFGNLLSDGLGSLSSTAFGNIQGQLGNILSGGLSSLQGQFGNLTSNLSSSFGGQIGNLANQFSGSFNGLTGLTSNLTSTFNNLQGSFGGIINNFGGVGNITNSLTSNFNNLQGQIGNIFGNATGQLGNLGSQLGNLTSNFSFGNLQNQLTNLNLGNLSGTFNNLQGQFASTLNNFNLGSLSGTFNNLQGQFASTLNNFNIGNLTGALNGVQGSVGDTFNNLKSQFSTFASQQNPLGNIFNNFSGQVGNLTSNIGGLFNNLPSQFTSIASNLNGPFNNLQSLVGSINPSNLNGLLGSITGNSFPSISDKLKSLSGGVNSIQGSILNLPNISSLAQSSIGNLVSNFSGSFKGISVISNLNPPTIDSLVKTFNLPVGALNNIGGSLSNFGNLFNSAQDSLSSRFGNVQSLATAQLNNLSKLSNRISDNVKTEFEQKKTQVRNKLKDFVKKSKLNNYVYITPEGFPYFMFDGVSTIKLFGDAPMLKKLPSISFGLETKLTNLALGGIAAPEFNLSMLSGKLNKASELFSQLTGTSKAIGQTVNNAINNLKKSPTDVVSNLTNTVGNIKSLLPFNLIFQHFEPSTDKKVPELSGLTKSEEQKAPSKLVNSNFEPVLEIPSEILDKSDASNFVYQTVDIQYANGEKVEGVDYKYVYVEENTQKKILEAQQLDEVGETPKAIAILEDVSKASGKNNSIVNNLLDELKKKVLTSIQPIIKFMLEIVSTPLKVVVGIITYIMDLFKSFLNPFELVGKIIDFVSFKWMLDFFNPTSKNSIFAILGMKFNIEKYLTEFIPKLTSQLSIFQNLSSISSRLTQNFVSTFTGNLSGLFNNLQAQFGNGFDVQSQISNLTNQFQGIFNNLQGSFGNLGSNLSGTLEGLQGQFGSVFKNLQSQFNNVASNLTSTLPGALNNLTGQIGNITSNLSGTLGNLQSQFGNITSNLSGVVTNFTGQFGSTINNFGNIGSNLASNLSGTLNNLGGQIGGSLNNITSSLNSQFGSTFNNLASNFSGTFNNLGGQLGNTFNSLGGQFGSTFNNLTSNLSGTFNNVGGQFGSTLNNLTSNLSGSFNLGGQFGSTFNNLGGQIGNLASSFTTNLTSTFNNAGQIGNFDSNLTNNLTDTFNNLQLPFNSLTSNFPSTVNNLQNRLGDFTSQFGSVDNLKAQFGNFAGQSGNVIDNLKGQFGNLVDGFGNLNLQGQLGNLSTNLTSNLGGFFNSIGGQVTSVVSNLNGPFQNLDNLIDDLKPNIPITFDALKTSGFDLSKLRNGVNSVQSSLLNFSNFPNTAQSALSNLTLNAKGVFNNISVVSNLNPPSIESLSKAFNINTNAFQGLLSSRQSGLNNITSSLSGSFGSIKSFIGSSKLGLTKNLSAAQISLGKLSNNLSLSLGKAFDFSKVSLSKFGSKFDLSQIIDMPFFAGKYPTYSLRQFEIFHSLRAGLPIINSLNVSLPKLPSFPVKSLSSILCLIEAIINGVIDLIWGLLGLGSLIPTPHLKLCRDSNQNVEMSDIAKLLSGAFDDPSKETNTENGPSYNFVFNIVSSDGREVRNLNREELNKWIEENRDIQVV